MSICDLESGPAYGRDPTVQCLTNKVSLLACLSAPASFDLNYHRTQITSYVLLRFPRRISRFEKTLRSTSNMDNHKVFRFAKPDWLKSPNTRTAGVYLAGALVRVVVVLLVFSATSQPIVWLMTCLSSLLDSSSSSTPPPIRTPSRMQGAMCTSSLWIGYQGSARRLGCWL